MRILFKGKGYTEGVIRSHFFPNWKLILKDRICFFGRKFFPLRIAQIPSDTFRIDEDKSKKMFGSVKRAWKMSRKN